MPTIKIVRYATAPEHADTNELLVRDVFAELASTRPDGLRYAPLRLDDRVSFVHIAVLDSDDNPLNSSVAFTAFQGRQPRRGDRPPRPGDLRQGQRLLREDHLPGLKIVMPGMPEDAAGLLISSIRDRAVPSRLASTTPTRVAST